MAQIRLDRGHVWEGTVLTDKEGRRVQPFREEVIRRD